MSSLFTGYYKAAMYADYQVAGEAYSKIHDILLAHEDLNLSGYRYFHLTRLTWCVVVIGQRPPERFNKQFTDILSSGEAITLEEREIAKLLLLQHKAEQ